jgi:branched-subunit amino acid aminotransferase/4-amino-4-deoxychorismate lyase
VEGDTLITPPLDGRLLGGILRARLLAAPPAGLEAGEAAISVERLDAADEVLLTSSVRGVHPAAMSTKETCFEVGARVRASLEQELATVGAP